MIKRLLVALLLLWPTSGQAVELPGWMTGQPPKTFMSRWIEAPFGALEEEYVFSLRQLDQLLRDRFDAKIRYREDKAGIWIMDAAWVHRESRGLQVIERERLLSMAFGPGRFEDTMEVRSLVLNGEPFSAMDALRLITEWGKAIKRLAIE